MFRPLLVIALLTATAASAQDSGPSQPSSDGSAAIAAPDEVTRPDPSVSAAQRPVSGGVRVLRELGFGLIGGVGGGALGLGIGAAIGLGMDGSAQCPRGSFIYIPCYMIFGVLGGAIGVPVGSVVGVSAGGGGAGSVFGALAGGLVGVLVSAAFPPLVLALPLVGAILGYEASVVLVSPSEPRRPGPRSRGPQPLAVAPFATPDGGSGFLVSAAF